jgi:hypothetical protein
MNKKQLSKDTKAAKKQVSKPNAFSKDVIVTKRGQWDYPGQVTRIPGNQITMKNVPYPVLGIDDQGNQQMMFPGQDYVFPGSYVTEYPQLQLGGEGMDKLLAAQTVGRINQIHDSNANKDFVQRAVEMQRIPSYDVPRIRNNDGTFSTHKMVSGEVDGRGIAFPTIVRNPDSSLIELSPDDAFEYARANNEAIIFSSPEEANWYAQNYKTRFESGGEPYQELELDDDQIAYYRSLGYRVEEVPTMQKGGDKTTSKIPPIGSIKRKPYSMSPEEVWYSQHPEARMQGSLYNKPVRPIGMAPVLPTATPSTTYTQKAIDKKAVDTPVRETQYLIPDENQGSTEDQINRAYWESVYNPTTLEQVGSAMRKPLQWMGDPFSLVGDVTSTVGVNPGLPTTDEMDIAHRKLVNNPYLSNQDRFGLSMNEGAGLASMAILNAIPFEEALWQGTKKIGKRLLPKGTTRYAEDYANEIFLEPSRVTPFSDFSLNEPTNNFDLEELRRAFHNNERLLTQQERNVLRKQGYGSLQDYRRNTQPLFDTDLLQQDYINMVNGLPPINYPNLSQAENISLQLSLNPRRILNSTPAPFRPKILKNKSGLTKEELLEKVPAKDKDVISKMSESEFENTVLKPSGEIVPYQQGKVAEGVEDMLRGDYIKAFNEHVDDLNNTFINHPETGFNKSGIRYEIKGMDDDGSLVAYTPKQTVRPKLTSKQKANIEWFDRDPKDFLINKIGLKQEGTKWRIPHEGPDFPIDEDEGIFNSLEEAITAVGKEINELTMPKVVEGNQLLGFKIRKPGRWYGTVEDIPSLEYQNSIPGLRAFNTASGIFPSDSGLRGTPGTGLYDAINAYMKKYGLGRVSDGASGQSRSVFDSVTGEELSRGSFEVWEGNVNKNKAFGFYSNPQQISAMLKVMLPLGTGYLGYKGLEGTSSSTDFGLREGWGKGQSQPQTNFRDGGESFETEMSDDAIEYYRRLGYRIEEI